jgi:hypothetical protein
MSANEPARGEREFPTRPAESVSERRPEAREALLDDSRPVTGVAGSDTYGCVEWFDYCPVPREEPPVRRLRN